MSFAADLQKQLTSLAEELDVPGAAAGVVVGEETSVAVHGVTNIQHPLDVDEQTLFQFGSTGKTYTATALMTLVESGRISLDAPVRTYVPELELADPTVAEQVTILQLLNHTAGWAGDSIEDTGDGDDCLATFVTGMRALEQVSPLGATVSYNNASLVLAGHVLSRVTGQTYEAAVRELVLEPLELEHTFGFGKEIMTHRFVSGHTRAEDGTLTVARPWALPRAGAPAGGWTATIGDQLTWAKFHLGQVPGPISNESRLLMQQPTVAMPGSALGDAVGISWLLQEVGGVLQVGHGGSTIGQLSDFVMVPERAFGFACLTNSSPNGGELFGRLRTWALENAIGVTEAEPELAVVDDATLTAYAGTYDSSVAFLTIEPRDGLLVATVTITDETLQAADEPAEQPPIPLALVVGDGDLYVVASGEAKGMRGYFSRDGDGRVTGINFSGRNMVRRA